MPSSPSSPPAADTNGAATAAYFDFRAAQRVPESHAWSGLHEHEKDAAPVAPSPPVNDDDDDAVPVVDMRDADGGAAAAARAAEEWGGFLLVGHGVDGEILERAEAQAARLFALPAPEKARAARRAGGGGTAGYGVPPYLLRYPKRMWAEGYTFPPAAVRDEFRRVWPDAGDDYHRFCSAMEDYDAAMSSLGERLIAMFFKALDLADAVAAGETEQKIRDTLTSTIHLNMYPKCPDPERAVGLAAHTDSGFFTFILQSPVPGLQLLRCRPDRWVTVPGTPGALIVVVGDLFHVLTNGRFHSVLHRAVVNRESDRISMPYFLGPPANMKVAPLVATESLGSKKAIYRAVTWPEYMGIRDKLFGTNVSALTMIRVMEEASEEES